MNEIKESLDNTKSVVGVVTDIIRVASNSPAAAEAASNLGKTAVTITAAVNNLLLPLTAINFAFDKARKYFTDQFEVDLKKKLSDVPEENVIEPKPYLAGPALQGLSLTYDEPELRDMYLNLIASSMDDRVSSNVHPAFAEIIQQIAPFEAVLLQSVLATPNPLSIASIWRVDKKGGWLPLMKHLGNVTATDGEMLEVPTLEIMVENWKRLGLVQVDYANQVAGHKAYSWINSRPELQKLRDLHQRDGNMVTPKFGVMMRTALGQSFAVAVGLIEKPIFSKQS
ncbi:MAG TPA: DUF4393 domain-containing protein [Thiobacillaceae bacterium]|nr:DUF4393 domain-containing protein [Thiobacillaceae bacterium]